jgi:hypothetical protein
MFLRHSKKKNTTICGVIDVEQIVLWDRARPWRCGAFGRGLWGFFVSEASGDYRENTLFSCEFEFTQV